MIKKEKKVTLKEEIERDEHYYKLDESVARLTGVTHFNCDKEGSKQNTSYNLSLTDKFVYSVMRHRYLSFKSYNDKANAQQKKVDGRFYFDNQVELAQRLGVDRKTVNKAIDKLVTLGVVEKFFQRAKNGSGMAVKSLSYKVNDLFCVQGVRCFFDVSTEGADCVERTFVTCAQVVQKQFTTTPMTKPLIKNPLIGVGYDDENCPF